jgi:polyribonucleotide nucleotidyltransferase
MNPKTDAGKLYAKLKKMSEQGVSSASEKCKAAIRKILNKAREVARSELVYKSPYADELQQIISDVNHERKLKGQEEMQFFKEVVLQGPDVNLPSWHGYTPGIIVKDADEMETTQ